MREQKSSEVVRKYGAYGGECLNKKVYERSGGKRSLCRLDMQGRSDGVMQSLRAKIRKKLLRNFINCVIGDVRV